MFFDILRCECSNNCGKISTVNTVIFAGYHKGKPSAS